MKCCHWCDDELLVIAFSFFFNDTATTEIYTYLHTLSLHDALPISAGRAGGEAAGIHPASANAPRNAAIRWLTAPTQRVKPRGRGFRPATWRSEEHTSELQSLMRISYAVFCLKKKKTYITMYPQYVCEIASVN